MVDVWTCCGVPKDNFRLDQIPLDCQRAYDLISQGDTYGVYQLQSYLGVEWAKKVRPKNLSEVGDLVSLIRPGALDSGQADDYVAVKSGAKKISYLHPKLQPILKSTYGTLVYQQQAMRIAQDIAGFDLQKSDILRKAIGKKKSDVMQSLKRDFIDGCVSNDVSEQIACQIFSWIQAGANYSFNKSHAISYAITSYRCAWLKAHYPVHFYCDLLKYSSNAPDQYEEIANIINDARLHDIKVIAPSLKKNCKNFEIAAQIFISYGIMYVKGIGSSKLPAIEQVGAPETFSVFLQRAIKYGLDKTVIHALIDCGALDSVLGDLNRGQAIMIADYIRGLGEKQRDMLFCFVRDKQLDILTGIQKFQLVITSDMFSPVNKEDKKYIVSLKSNRLKKFLEETSTTLKQVHKMAGYTPVYNASRERQLLGYPLTTHEVAQSKIKTSHKCIDVHRGAINQQFQVIAIIKDVFELTTKKGKNPGQKMARVTIEDDTLFLDGVLFPSQYQQYKFVLKPDRLYKVTGKVGDKGPIFNSFEQE